MMIAQTFSIYVAQRSRDWGDKDGPLTGAALQPLLPLQRAGGRCLGAEIRPATFIRTLSFTCSITELVQLRLNLYKITGLHGP